MGLQLAYCPGRENKLTVVRTVRVEGAEVMTGRGGKEGGVGLPRDHAALL